MKDTDWKEMREAAERLGAEYLGIITEMGKPEIEKMQQLVLERFRGEGQVQMNPGEWLIALRRYSLITECRDFGDMEIEKVLRLVFHLRWLHDWYSKLLEALSMTPAPDGKSDPVGAISVRNDLHKRRIRLRGLKDEKKAEIDDGDKAKAIEALNDLAQFTTEVIDIGYRFCTEVAEYEVASGIGKIDKEQVKSVHKVMGDIGKEIDALETELGLKTDRSEETYASKFSQTIQKAERFAKAHPREHTWWCPQCGWEGILLRRKPEEGRLINKLDLWWTWKCGDCGTVIAYDQAHPLYTGKMLFWRRAWDLVKQGALSLRNAAYLHECAPEHLVVAAQQIYREELPPHVQKEWDEIEAQSRFQHKDDRKVQEDLSDSGELEE